MVNHPEETGLQVLRRLRSTDPPTWLAPNPSLSQETRAASLHLFSSLKPFAPRSPFDELLVDGFDAEQIWQQIDLQSQPLLSSLRRELRRLEKDPDEISNLFGGGGAPEGKREGLGGGGDVKEGERGGGGVGDLVGGVGMEVDAGFDEFDEDGDSDEEEDEGGVEERAVEGGESGESGESEEGEEGRNDGGIEDKFLKIKELEEYLQKDEAREYGLEDANKKNKKEKKAVASDSDVDEEGEEDEDEEEEEEGDDDDDDDDEVRMG